ncbi:Cytochrome P450 superfamily protein [Prunus dulcis]|uniref:Cytochrome P450 superfamily protein n=1 Tax=Prunus dulcis TaxID=3755 RepID=A0A5H2XHU0_PRUDU|nr:Cytochrome P450 superfamily protein [Prunus dulcis]
MTSSSPTAHACLPENTSTTTTQLPLWRYGDHWRNFLRLMIVEIFSSSRVAMFSSVRRGEVRLLLNQIMKSSCAKNMTKIELKTKFMELSFNVMTMKVVGKRYYGEDVGDVGEAEEAKKLREVIRDAVDISGSTNMGDFLPVLQWIDLGVEKKMAGLMTKLDKFLQGLVNERRVILSSTNCSSDKGVKKLMIDNLLSMQETQPQV